MRGGLSAGLLALGRLPTSTMNKMEAEYAKSLSLLLHAGEIRWFKFEAIKLRLADNTFYTADFAVIAEDSVLELHEVKGFWTDDARVKIKVAADLYPFRFVAIEQKNGVWLTENFKREG